MDGCHERDPFTALPHPSLLRFRGFPAGRAGGFRGYLAVDETIEDVVRDYVSHRRAVHIGQDHDSDTVTPASATCC